VPVSIDPFFFRVTELDAGTGSDFYVRDWTDNPTSGDTGLEPSTHPVFYATSDVWNRRSNAPGAFNANDQPVNENPQNGTGPAGDNFAFARIRRNAPGSAETVTAHFLTSEFGTGSNYVNAGTAADPTVGFAAADLVKTMANGYPWHLDPTASTHFCLAVEISTSSDPIVAPSLLGRAPGWPTTDLMVINDNNKVQRNMGVYPASGTGRFSFFGIVHNAATFRRNVELRLEVSREAQRTLLRPRFEAIGGGNENRSFRTGDVITLAGMQPGENRWVGLTFQVREGREGEPLPVFLHEVVDGKTVNGFGIAARPGPLSDLIRENVELHASVFSRMASFGIGAAREEAELARRQLGDGRVREGAYVEFLRRADAASAPVNSLATSVNVRDPFGVRALLRSLVRAAQSASPAPTLAATHASLLHRLDAFITMLQKNRGDAADIAQTVAWQADLYSQVPQLQALNAAGRLVQRSREFVEAYGVRNATNADYPPLLRSLLGAFRETAAGLQNALPLAADIDDIERTLDSPVDLQRAHRAYLLKLESLRA
jgi:hypothetical protein